MKAKTINKIIFHVAQVLSIALSLIWFGWQGLIVVFLINWAINTSKYDK